MASYSIGDNEVPPPPSFLCFFLTQKCYYRPPGLESQMFLVKSMTTYDTPLLSIFFFQFFVIQVRPSTKHTYTEHLILSYIVSERWRR